MNAEDLVIIFKKNMANLSKTERRRAIESVRDVIRAAMFDDAVGSTYEVECCPRCGSTAIVKKGKSKNGEQRYLCRDCGRTFGMGSERILGTSKLPKAVSYTHLGACLAATLGVLGFVGVDRFRGVNSNQPNAHVLTVSSRFHVDGVKVKRLRRPFCRRRYPCGYFLEEIGEHRIVLLVTIVVIVVGIIGIFIRVIFGI